MTPEQRYRNDLAREGFRADPQQRRAVASLQALYRRLLQPRPAPSLWQRLRRRRPAPLQGVYLWGGPGRGKTYLMDSFHACLPFREKRRLHFHRFMLEVHQALEALPATPDPLPLVAARLAERCRVLCLDEFQVSDVADAMLLGGLLEALAAAGVTLVLTSNTRPDALYPHGLQRERFLPAIHILQSNHRVCSLEGGQDFRLQLLQRGGTYRIAEGAVARQWLDAQLHRLAPLALQRDAVISLSGRELRARALAEDAAWIDFEALCMQPRSARDYLQLAQEYPTLLLEGVPRMDEGFDEAARRFMHLIDALYDHGVKLVMTAAAPAAELYSGTRLETAFRRTASRLSEMSSRGYLARPHRP